MTLDYQRQYLTTSLNIINNQSLTLDNLTLLLNSPQFSGWIDQQGLISNITGALQRQDVKNLETFENLFFKQQILNQELANAADKFEKLLDKNQIKYTAIKGRYFQKRYPKYIRDLKDLDYYIFDDYKKLEKILLSDSEYVLESIIKHDHKNLHANTVKIKSGLEIDLHWQIAERFITPIPFNTQDLENLSTSSFQYLTVLIQAFKNNYNKLQNFIDLDFLSQQEDFSQVAIDLICENARLKKINSASKSAIAAINQSQELNLKTSNELASYYLYSDSFLDFLNRSFLRFVLPFGPDLKADSYCFALVKKQLRHIKKLFT